MTRRPRADRPVQQPFTLIMPTRSPGDRRALEAKLTHLLALPQDQNPLTAALDAIGTVHFARFVFVDDTRLTFVMTYDGDMTAYVNEFVDHLGPVFDMLLQHMADAPPCLSRDIDEISWTTSPGTTRAAFPRCTAPIRTGLFGTSSGMPEADPDRSVWGRPSRAVPLAPDAARRLLPPPSLASDGRVGLYAGDWGLPPIELTPCL